MSVFLSQVSAAHPEDFVVMVLDGASSHRAKELQRPENIRLVALPPYSPELNPQEHVWDELREKEFPNRVFNDLDAVIRQLHSGLPRLCADHEAVTIDRGEPNKPFKRFWPPVLIPIYPLTQGTLNGCLLPPSASI